MCRKCTQKSIESSRSIHWLLGNPSSHAVEAYRDSGEARCANRLQHLPPPLFTLVASTVTQIVCAAPDLWLPPELRRPSAQPPVQSAHSATCAECADCTGTRADGVQAIGGCPSLALCVYVDTPSSLTRNRMGPCCSGVSGLTQNLMLCYVIGSGCVWERKECALGK